MALSRKKLAQIKTYEPSDITSVGWAITLYADGHLSAQSRCRWQGGRDGERYVTDPDYVVLEKDDNPQEILENLFSDECLAFFDEMLEQRPEWRCTDRGIKVR